MLALLFAQVAIPTIAPIAPTPTPAAISERAVLERGLERAAVQAKALGGTLGAVVIDVANGAKGQINGDRAFPIGGAQQLALAVVTARAIDDGRLREQQVGDETALLAVNGGADAVNGELRNLGYGGIVIGSPGNGFAKPLAVASMLADVQSDKILSASSAAPIVAAAQAGIMDSSSDIAIVRYHGRTLVVVTMLDGVNGDAAARRSLFASVRQSAEQTTLAFPI